MKGFLSAALFISLVSSPCFAAKAKTPQQPYMNQEDVEVHNDGDAPSATVTTTTSISPGKAASATGFDIVPTSQTEPFIRRLKLAEALLTRYGRAYDYRAMTVIDLQHILDKLDSESQKQTADRARERQHEQSVIRSQAAANNESAARIQESHNSIGAEAPEPAL
jgi:hypothetical protein